ncbi:MAG: cell wall-active antibiotics response protein LiaF, partial [Staphylococcus saprophyticus]
NNIKVVEETKAENYAVNIYVSSFLGDVEVIYK